jgi:hypothetical protein
MENKYALVRAEWIFSTFLTRITFFLLVTPGFRRKEEPTKKVVWGGIQMMIH